MWLLGTYEGKFLASSPDIIAQTLSHLNRLDVLVTIFGKRNAIINTTSRVAYES